jgi:hypothetical protein
MTSNPGSRREASCAFNAFGAVIGRQQQQQQQQRQSLTRVLCISCLVTCPCAQEADFFYVPVYAACFTEAVAGWADAPWWNVYR